MNYEERMYWRSASGRSVGELAQKWSFWHHCTDTSIVATFAANLSSKVAIGTHCAPIMEILSSTLCFFCPGCSCRSILHHSTRSQRPLGVLTHSMPDGCVHVRDIQLSEREGSRLPVQHLFPYFSNVYITVHH